MINICELCRLDALEPAYGQDGASASTIWICGHCGLTQSRRAEVAERSNASFDPLEVSAENKRVGRAVELLRGHADLSLPLSVLDVGAGRGKFVRAFLSTAPRASLTAVEPNQGQAWACAFLNRSNIISKRIEETCFPDEHFDIIHSYHTLEHLESPLAVLADHWRVLKPGGVLVVECRNISAISDEAIVGEW
ncbi:MAG: class I SAM-dependent methyltransferase, partial [Micropepsaceae bacterium]